MSNLNDYDDVVYCNDAKLEYIVLESNTRLFAICETHFNVVVKSSTTHEIK